MKDYAKSTPGQIIRSNQAVTIITAGIAIAWLACMVQLFLWVNAPVYIAFPAIVITEVLLCLIVYANCTIKWQIWAYNNVTSIFELDQTQGFQSSINLKNYPEIPLLISDKDYEKKAEITIRLHGTFEFIDDIEVPDSLTIKYASLRSLIYDEGDLVLSSEGIVLPDYTRHTWGEIKGEDVIQPRANKTVYKMEYRVGNVRQQLPLNKVSIDPFQLKHFLYVYRQRYRLANGEADIVNVLEDAPLFTNSPFTPTDRLLAEIFKMMTTPAIRVTSIALMIATSLYLLVSIIQSLHYKVQNDDAYDGIITGKYINHQAHGARNIMLSGYGNISVQWNTYEHLDSGDHVIKKKGEMKTFVIRGTDTTVYDVSDF